MPDKDHQLKEALRLIRSIALETASSNSEPDRMGEALDNIVGRCQGFLREHGSAPAQATTMDINELFAQEEARARAQTVQYVRLQKCDDGSWCVSLRNADGRTVRFDGGEAEAAYHSSKSTARSEANRLANFYRVQVREEQV